MLSVNMLYAALELRLEGEVLKPAREVLDRFAII
jgi:hypothetical protein